MTAVLHIYNSHPLKDFLNQHGGCAPHEATVTAMGTELKGKWLIADSDYPRFLDLLHDYLFVKKARSLNLVEQPRVNHHKPLLLDLDFKYSSDSAINRSFTDNHIKAFCEDVVKGLEHFFGLDEYEDGIRFFVTLRPGPCQGKKERKDGIHIECPDICLTNEKQKVLRLWLLNKKSVQTCFADTGYINKDEEVYDESMTRKQGWFFFGESKPNIPRYELKNIICYNAVDKKFSSEDIGMYNTRDLMEILSIRYNLTDDGNLVREDVSAEYQALLNPPKTFQATAQGGDGPAHEVNVTENEVLSAIRNMIIPKDYNEGEKNIFRRLVIECLSQERADNRDTWMRVGWCLHNIQPDEEMFNLWMDFSKKSQKFSENNMNTLRRDWFSNMRKIGDGPRLTEMSLRKWARDDNHDMYREIVDADVIQYLLTPQFQLTHYHISCLMEKIYKSNYKASIGMKNTDWYYYDDDINFWKLLNQGIQLRRNISFEVTKYIQKAREARAKQIDTGGNANEISKDGKWSMLFKVEQQLYTAGFIDSLMKMAATYFYEEDFQDKLNSNVYLYGCRNGVLELRAITDENPKEHVIFRPGRPEDFISFRAGHNPPKCEAMNYIPMSEFNSEQKEQLAFIKDFFAKIFPDTELRTYVQRLLASCLEGTNREQCYYTFIGEGSNGKSVLINLCEITFGDYFTSLQTTVLTRKRPESGSANPEIIVIKNKRFISMQEPDEKEPINTSRMKQFSGEDLIEARGLYQDQQKFRATGKLFMMTNKLPPINSMDYGTWRRVRAVPFKSKFVSQDHPDWGKPNHFLKDKEYEKKLHPCREVFFSWLVHLYETEYLVHGLEPVPAAVKKETDDYKEGFDSFAKFRNDRLERAPGERTLFKNISNAYREWLSDGHRSGSRLSPKELEKRLNSEFGEPTDGKTYTHVKLKVEEEDSSIN
jgi:P4 family phage/plasmid primase-like protien